MLAHCTLTHSCQPYKPGALLYQQSICLSFKLAACFLLLIKLTNVTAQSTNTHLVKPVIILPQLPSIASIAPPVVTTHSAYNNTMVPAPTLIDNGSIQQRNQQLIQEVNQGFEQPGNPQQVQQLADIERDMMEIEGYRKERELLIQTQAYRQAFNELKQLNPDSFSITKAVFTVENAWYNNTLSYSQLTRALQERAALVKQILQREKLSPKNNLAINYGIQKMYAQANPFYSAKYKQTVQVPPFKYDFDDYRGEKDYSKMFVWKLLATGKGQCHSMPLAYLMIAEQLGAKASLSLAPQHSFIQFTGGNGKCVNFETTNGSLVSNAWLVQSGFITAQALQNKTYLDTLSTRKLYAQVMGDLLLGYLSKFPYDAFAERLQQEILGINPRNLTALMVDANTKTQAAMQQIKAAGSPKPEDLPSYPEAYQAWQQMQAAQDRVTALGYQDMPEEQYQQWLQTIEREKKRQANQQLKEDLQQQLQQLKKVTFTNTKPKQ